MTQLLNPIHNINPDYILTFDENPLKLRISNIVSRSLDNEMIIFGLNALSCMSPYYNMTTSSVRIYLKNNNITYEQMETDLTLSFLPDEIFSTYKLDSFIEHVRCDHYYNISFQRLYNEINNTILILKVLFTSLFDLDDPRVACEFIDMDHNDIISLNSIQKAPFRRGEWSCRYLFNFNWNNIDVPVVPLAPVGVIYNFNMRIVIRRVKLYLKIIYNYFAS